VFAIIAWPLGLAPRRTGADRERLGNPPSIAAATANHPACEYFRTSGMTTKCARKPRTKNRAHQLQFLYGDVSARLCGHDDC